MPAIPASNRRGVSLALTLALIIGGCAAAGTSGPSDGEGGSAAGGTTGGGGANASTGGATGSGGVTGSGGAPGTGGSNTGAGGHVTTGAGGSGMGGASGTGGRGGSGAGGRATGGATGTGGHIAGTVRIMALGDSTTGSVCWRAMLWTMLNQGGFSGRFNFVGSRNNDPGCNVPGYDTDNEGHPSVLITNFINDADDIAAGVQTPQALLGQNPADVVLFHFATNDVWNGSISNAAILAAYTTVLAALRAANPKVIVLAAQLIPLVPINVPGTCSACACPTACDQRMVTFNSMIPAWAAANSTASSPIMVVDQHTGFVSTTDTVDGVHPNAAGSMKIAAKWYAALTPLF
jgi:lysophospholipase L1-like esterase